MEREQALDRLIREAVAEFEQATSSAIKTMATPCSVFDVFVRKCVAYHETPAHSLDEMRRLQSTKAKGDLFECFCARFLATKNEYENVWLLSQVPAEIKSALRLPPGNGDYGIDIVCRAKNGAFSAVQCKFKAPTKPKKVNYRAKNGHLKTTVLYPSVGWRELATFNALCAASGPWAERVTMTTAPCVRRLGGIKDKTDKSICCGTFRALTPEFWKQLSSARKDTLRHSNATSSTPSTSYLVLSNEQLRAKRLRYFESSKNE